MLAITFLLPEMSKSVDSLLHHHDGDRLPVSQSLPLLHPHHDKCPVEGFKFQNFPEINPAGNRTSIALQLVYYLIPVVSYYPEHWDLTLFLRAPPAW